MKNIVAATLRLITIGLLLMLVGLATMSTAAAQLETFLVRASDGSYYQYHSEALNRAYLRAQINPDAVAGTQMYRHFEGLLTAGGTVVGLKDSDRGYFDYQAICAAHISAQLAQQGFDVNAYFGCEDAKKLAAPVTGLKQVDDQGQVSEIPDPVVEPQHYDAAGTYGPASGSETIATDVVVGADGVILQNLLIQGDLTISEAVGDGTVTLNKVTVAGDTFVRGGGANSIHLNGGQYSRIIMEKTASGAVRIVATGVDGLEVVIAEDAAGETIILDGAFDSITVNAPNMTITTQGATTTIGTMTVGADGGGTTLNLAAGTRVAALELNAKTAVKGQGTVVKAEVKADGVVFDKKPASYTVAPGVVAPVFPSPGGGGYNPPEPVAVTGVSLNKSTLELIDQGTETLTAIVTPTNAANKAVSFSSSNEAVATVDASTGLVTAVAVGTATITVTTSDGSKQASCEVTVAPVAVTGVSLEPATLNLVYEDTANLTATVAPANATNPGITWASSDTSVATVDQNGKVTAVHAGTAEISASSQADSTIKATKKVTVQGRLKIYDSKAVAGSDDGNFVAMLLEGDTFKDISSFDFIPGTTGLALGSPTRSTNNYSFLLANTAAAGTLTLQAKGLTSGVDSTTVSLTVVSVTLDKETADLTVGGNLNLIPTVLPAEAVDQAVSWSSDTPAVATVNEAGVVSGVTPGTAIITAKAASGSQDSCTVTVKPLFETTGTETAVTMTKYNGSETNVVIPATINSIPVTAIGANAFSGNASVTAVTLPATVTTLGEQAFQGCVKLNTVDLPATITSIPSQAFENCPLIDITIGAGVTIADAAAMGQWGTSFITTYNTNGAGNYHCYFNVVHPLVVWTYGQVVENGMSFNTSTQTINAYRGSGVAVTIPAQISGVAVTTLYKGSFTSKNLTGLTFAVDSQLVAIGDGAFFSNNLGNLSCRQPLK